ncbi:S8 family serine peptidase [Sorangium sp. So ce134]
MAITSEFAPFVKALAAALPANRRFGGSLMDDAIDAIAGRRGSASNAPEMRALLSEERARYIIAPPRFERSAGPSARAQLDHIRKTIPSSAVRGDGAGDHQLLLLSPLEAAVVKERFGALVIEKDAQHHLPRTPLAPLINPISVPPGEGMSVTVLVRGPAAPLAGARVIVQPSADRDDGYEGVTGPTGELQITVRGAEPRFARIIVIPRMNYWSRVVTDVRCAAMVVVDVMPLSPSGFDWGLRETGAPSRGDRHGRAIKVAIIDSGIARHPSLPDVKRGKNFILGEDPSAWDRDQDGHGTHCAGIVAALARDGSTWGYAPEVELHAYRVFGGPDGGGWASDIAAAVREATRSGCDLINLSVASHAPSGLVRRAIEEAVEAGVVCTAAAGNEGGEVAYPARLPGVLAVSAIGKTETYPVGTLHGDAREGGAKKGGWFLASFSNRGPEVAFAGPGVAVTSTLPGGFGAWDGTSMACAHATGLAAIALDTMMREASPAALPRSPERAARLVDRLLGTCIDLGLARDAQGAGLLHMGRGSSPEAEKRR